MPYEAKNVLYHQRYYTAICCQLQRLHYLLFCHLIGKIGKIITHSLWENFTFMLYFKIDFLLMLFLFFVVVNETLSHMACSAA